MREHPGIVGSALILTLQAEDRYDPGELQIGRGTLQWNKEIENWEFIKFGDRAYDKPQDIRRHILARGAFLKKGDPVTDPTTGLEITILGRAKRDFKTLGRGRNVDRTTYLKMALGDTSFFVKINRYK